MSRNGKALRLWLSLRACHPLQSRVFAGFLIALFLLSDFSGILQVEAQRLVLQRSHRSSFSSRQPNVLLPSTSNQAAPPGSTSGAYPSYPVNHTLDAYPQILSDGPTNWDFETAGSVVGTPPADYTFETAQSNINTPTNWDFASGTLTGWDVVGAVTVGSGGPDGYFASFPSSGTTSITSSAFTVSSTANALQLKLNSGYVDVILLTGASYATSTTLATVNCGSGCSWTTLSYSMVSYIGQSVKVRLRSSTGYSGPEVDQVRTVDVAPGWTLTGNPLLATISGSTWLTGSTVAISPAFTVDATAQFFTFDTNRMTTSNPQREIYILSGATFTTVTKLGYFSYGTSDNTATYRVPIYQYAGQTVKIRIGDTSVGLVALDNVGIQRLETPGWSYTYVSQRKFDDGLGVGSSETAGALGADGYDPGSVLVLTQYEITESAAFSIPSGAQQIMFQVRASPTSVGTPAITVKFLSGAGYATVTSPTGGTSYQPSSSDWEYLVLPISSFAGQSIKLRISAGNRILLNDVGFTGSVTPGWTVLGDSDAVTVRNDAVSGTYLQAQDITKKLSVASSLTSIGIISNAASGDGRSVAIGYQFGPNTSSTLQVKWVPVISGVAQTPISVYFANAGSTSNTGYKDARFLVRKSNLPTDGSGNPIQTGYYTISGSNGARLYQIADNLAKEQQAEPFRQSVGNGIDSATGNFSWQETDLVLEGGPMPIVFTRYYTAHSDRLGSLGYRWRNSYDIQLYIGPSASIVAVLFGDGHEEAFELDTGVYVPLDPRIQATLTYDAGTTTYTYATVGKMEYRFLASGLLYRVEDPTGNQLDLAYDGSDRLESVTTFGGRAIELSYDANDRLEELTGPSGETVTYTYSDHGDLVSVATNDGQQTDYFYSRHRMRKIWVMDASGPDETAELKQIVANKLDDYNRVTRQTDASGVDIQIHYQQDFTSPTPVAAVGVTFVKDRSTAGGITQYYFDHNGRSTYVVTPEEVVTQFVYDGDGNLSSWVDGSGGAYAFTYDVGDPHKITGIIDPLNNTRSITVNAEHKPTVTEDAFGVNTTFAYDVQARITEKIIDPGSSPHLNLKSVFTYDPGTGLMSTTVLDPDGLAIKTQWEYNTDGLVERRILDPDGLNLIWEYAYNDSGRLLVEVDPSGLRKRYTYTLFGRIETTIVDPTKNPSGTNYSVDPGVTPLNLVSRYVFDFGGKLTATMDPECTFAHPFDGRPCQSEWYYNEMGLVTDKYDTLDVRTHYDYNDLGQMTRTIQDKTMPTSLGIEKNFSTEYEYDADGRLKNVIVDPAGFHLVTHYTYDPAGRLKTEVLDYGSSPHYNLTTTYIYDAKGRLIGKQTPGMGPTEGWTYEYDDNDRLILTTDPEGRESENVYDAAGRLHQSIVDPDGEALTTTYTYDKANRLTDTESSSELITHIDYDGASRPIATMIDPGGAELESETIYNPNGSVWKTIDPEGRVTERTYDRAGRLYQTIVDPDGEAFLTTYEYDLNSQLERVTDPDGVVTEYHYDLMGRQTELIVDPGTLAITSHTIYDRLGRAEEVVNPRGYSTTTEYDTAGRISTVTNAGSPAGVLTYGYDSAGRLADVTDPLGSVTHTTYDAFSNPDSVTYADGTMTERTWQREFDLNGAVTRVQDPNSNDLRYFYDTVGRLEAITDPLEDPYVSYGYDAAGRTESIVNANGTISYDYNDLGQVESVTQNGQSIGYTYTDLGQRETMTLPGSRTVTYAYDPDTAMLETVRDWSNQPLPTEYDWTDAGRLESITRPTDEFDPELDIVSEYGYDTAGRLTGISHSQDSIYLAEYGYALDANGNRTGVTVTGTAVITGSETYVYNPLDQLTSATYVDSGSASFTYDANGNRETVASGGETTSYAYDDLGQLSGITSTDVGFDPIMLFYDNNGNRIQSSDGTSTRDYAWDWGNRLTGVDVGGVDTDYEYLGDDTRLSQTTSSGTTDYLVERQGGLPQVVDDGSSAYLHDVTGNSIAIDGTTDDATYPLEDALGSTRLTLDDTGSPLGSTDWDAWGNERTSAGSSFEFGYTGQQYDDSADLYFNRARFYSPGTGQFLSRDTLQPNTDGATGHNSYQYANGNPTTFADPGGHLAGPRDFGGGIAGAFFYLAYVLECFLSGNCLYRSQNGDNQNEMASSPSDPNVPGAAPTKLIRKAALRLDIDVIASGIPSTPSSNKYQFDCCHVDWPDIEFPDIPWDWISEQLQGCDDFLTQLGCSFQENCAGVNWQGISDMAGRSLRSAAEYLSFGIPLPDFACVANHPGSLPSMGLDFSQDHCSKSFDNPLGMPFEPACNRHDFGYRNYKAIRQTEMVPGRIPTEFNDSLDRNKVDDQFLDDLYWTCNYQLTEVTTLGCHWMARQYYKGVSQWQDDFGDLI